MKDRDRIRSERCELYAMYKELLIEPAGPPAEARSNG